MISPKAGQVQGMNHDDKGDKFKVEKTLDSVSARDFDAPLLPGGVANPYKLRMIPEAVTFVSSFARQRRRKMSRSRGDRRRQSGNQPQT
jgi:protease I